MLAFWGKQIDYSKTNIFQNRSCSEKSIRYTCDTGMYGTFGMHVIQVYIVQLVYMWYRYIWYRWCSLVKVAYWNSAPNSGLECFRFESYWYAWPGFGNQSRYEVSGNPRVKLQYDLQIWYIFHPVQKFHILEKAFKACCREQYLSWLVLF